MQLRTLMSLAFGAVSLAMGSFFPNNGKISPDLNEADPSTTTEVIVQYSRRPDDNDHQNVRAHGGVKRADLPLVKGVLYSVPVKALEVLSRLSNVSYISPNRKNGGFLDVTAPTVNAPLAWQYGWDGTGVGIAIIDSGVTALDDFQYANSANSRIVYSQDFTGLGTTDDSFGHGTHVTGVAAGNGKVSSGVYKGIAPNAQIINLRVLDQNGVGYDANIVAAIQTAIQLKHQYNIRVINLSLGRPVFESYTLDPICQALEQAWQNGIVVVAAAGNNGRDNSMGTSGYAIINSPANDPYVITVGAMKTLGTISRSDDLVASYSSKGPSLLDHIVKPDIVAPGNVVASTLAKHDALYGLYPGNQVYVATYTGSTATNWSPLYYRLSGTSMATPVVSGAAAILLQKQPSLTPDQLKARLMKTATKLFPTTSTAVDPATGITYVSQYDIFTIGAGYLDIAGALANTDLIPANTMAQSPAAVYDAASVTFT